VFTVTPPPPSPDLISAASGLAPMQAPCDCRAPRRPNTAHAVVLDPGGLDTKVEQSQFVSRRHSSSESRRARLCDRGRGATRRFAVDPVQGLTIVQALSLAWGATPNASVSKSNSHPRPAWGPYSDHLEPTPHDSRSRSRQPVRDRDSSSFPTALLESTESQP